MKKLGLIVDMAGEVLPLVGAASDAGQALVKAIGSLAKFVPPGSVSPADKEQMLKQMLIKNQQNTQMVSQLQQQQQKPAAPADGMPKAA